MIDDARSKTIALARSSLADARVELDDAVNRLSGTGVETVMASSDLLRLLLRVVAAKDYLESMEHRSSSGPPASLR